jgi:molybdate transport system substrate-binding protein
LSEAADISRTALTVLSAGAVQGVVEPVAAGFAREAACRMDLVFNTVGATRAKIEAGEAADLVIVSRQAAQALQAAGALPGGSRALGRVGMGLAVRAGAPAPDIASVDAFRNALLQARSVAYTNPAAGGTGGIYFAELLQRLGLADAIRTKAVLASGGHDVAARVARGEAAIGVTIISEIAAVPGAGLGAPLPAELQNYTTYVAALPATSRDRTLAERFIGRLTHASAAELWRAAGFEPAD